MPLTVMVLPNSFDYVYPFLSLNMALALHLLTLSDVPTYNTHSSLDINILPRISNVLCPKVISIPNMANLYKYSLVAASLDL